jgi:hypothetical protein
LDTLSPEERRKVYVILNLTVEALADGGLQINGAFGEENPVCAREGTSRRSFFLTTKYLHLDIEEPPKCKRFVPVGYHGEVEAAVELAPLLGHEGVKVH